MVTWTRTDLHVEPPLIEMADTDRETLDIPLGVTVATVAATIADYTAPGTMLPDLIESVTLNGTNDGADVTISGLTRGTLYEVSVVGTTAGGRIVTSLLAIRCVA